MLVTLDVWDDSGVRHLYACPLRWADLDVLGHVNNVVYVDYLQEARVDMLRVHARGPMTGDLAEAVVVVSHRVEYAAPLLFGPEPVLIECWVTQIRAASFTMAYELFHERDGGRVVYARARTVLTPYVFGDERPRRLRPEEVAALEVYLEPDQFTRTEFGPIRRTDVGYAPVQVRFSDVDVYGHVNNVKYLEFFQESRISQFTRVLDQLPPGTVVPSMVVARQDIDYKVPVLFRAEPYDSWTWVAKLGTTSMTLEAVIADGETVLARGRFVMVFFDPATGRATPPPEEVRALIAAAP